MMGPSWSSSAGEEAGGGYASGLASESHVEAWRKVAVVCSIPPSEVGIGIGDSCGRFGVRRGGGGAVLGRGSSCAPAISATGSCSGGDGLAKGRK